MRAPWLAWISPEGDREGEGGGMIRVSSVRSGWGGSTDGEEPPSLSVGTGA